MKRGPPGSIDLVHLDLLLEQVLRNIKVPGEGRPMQCGPAILIASGEKGGCCLYWLSTRTTSTEFTTDGFSEIKDLTT